MSIVDVHVMKNELKKVVLIHKCCYGNLFIVQQYNVIPHFI